MDHDGRVIDVDAVAPTVARFGEPLIATYWIDNALPFATLFFGAPGLAAFARSFRFLIDDTFGGRVSEHSIASAGGRSTMLALPGDSLRLTQVHAVMAARSSCVFPVDGGGPYHEVGTGIVGLATALRAAIVPISVQASRSIVFPHRSRLTVPLPGGRVVVGVGAPIAVRKTDPRRDVAAVVKASLDRLALVASAAVAKR